MKKRGLGRGLDALLPDTDENLVKVQEISLSLIDRNKKQPRRRFDEEALKALSESIKTSGVLSPLLVVEDNGRYRIVAGERRFRASSLAGLQTVPCIVRDLNKQQEMEASLIENLQREDLNAIEEASAIKLLMEECAYTQEMAAQRLSKSRSAVANTLRLLQLDDNMQKAVIEEKISAGHARVLVGIDDKTKREFLFEKTMRENLSVRALEKLSKTFEVPQAKIKKEKVILPELSDMQERLRLAVGVKTMLVGNEKKGKFVFQYQNKDELDLIYAALEVLESK